MAGSDRPKKRGADTSDKFFGLLSAWRKGRGMEIGMRRQKMSRTCRNDRQIQNGLAAAYEKVIRRESLVKGPDAGINCSRPGSCLPGQLLPVYPVMDF